MPDSGLNASSLMVRRLKSLDVLRAIAILLMIFSGLLPKTLPNWMDHGYNPHFLPDASGTWTLRPEVTAQADLYQSNWPAFTWVDLVFPMFLFAMGASIPLALSRMLAVRKGTGSILLHIASRWLILIVFAALVSHLSLSFLQSSVPNTGRLVVISSFLLVFLFFLRWPAGSPVGTERTIRIAALIGIAMMIIAYATRNGTAFSWARSDKIILVLAQTYLLAAIIWLLSKNYPGIRFVVLVPIMLMAHYMQFRDPAFEARRWLGNEPFVLLGPIVDGITRLLNLNNWIGPDNPGEAWTRYVAPTIDLSPLWNFSWYKFLFVVIPGTIAGDWLRAWATRRTVGAVAFEPELSRPVVSKFALPGTLLLCVAIFVGLRHLGYPLMGVGGPMRTPWLALLLGVPALLLLGKQILPTAYGSLWICRRLYYFGAAFVLIGLVLTSLPASFDGGYLEGGISKGPPATLSYYCISVGLCSLLLMALAGLLDYNFNFSFTSSMLQANGQNALLAYYIAHTVLGAITSLSFLHLIAPHLGPEIGSIDDYFYRFLHLSGWMLAAWAAVKTLIVACIVWIFSACRLYWRA